MPYFNRSNSGSVPYDHHTDHPHMHQPARQYSNTHLKDHSDIGHISENGINRTLSSRRTSIFGLRAVTRLTAGSQRLFASASTSTSGTPSMTSRAPSIKSRPPSITSRAPSVASSPRSSKDTGSVRNYVENSEGTGSRTKNLLMRGRRLKRHGSKLSVEVPLNDRDAVENTSEEAVGCAHSSEAEYSCRYIAGYGHRNISRPFGFRHVTHSQAQQFRNLESTSQNDLVAEFSAVRAAQRSRPDLRGIKAEDLRSRSSSIDAQQTSQPTSGATSPHLSMVPSLTSAPSEDSLHTWSLSSQTGRHHGRASRSRESFSQPFIASRMAKTPDGTLVPPPRTSSIAAYTRDRPNPPRDSGISGFSDHRRNTSDPGSAESQDSVAEFSPSESSDAISESFAEVHAISTLDDSATELQPPYVHSFGSMLPAVCEEDISASTSRSVSSSREVFYDAVAESSPMEMPQRASAIRSESQASVRTVVLASSSQPRQMPQLPDPLDLSCNPRLSRFSYGHRFSMRRTSTTDGLFSSWEDDVDFSYDNSAETESDFKWVSENNDKRTTVIGPTPTALTEQSNATLAPIQSLSVETEPANLAPAEIPTPLKVTKSISHFPSPSSATKLVEPPTSQRLTDHRKVAPKAKTATPSPLSRENKKSKIPVNPGHAPVEKPLAATPPPSLKNTLSPAIPNPFEHGQRKSSAIKSSLPRPSSSGSAKLQRTASDGFLTRPSTSPRSITSIPAHTSDIPPIPPIPKRRNHRTSYTISLFPSPPPKPSETCTLLVDSSR